MADIEFNVMGYPMDQSPRKDTDDDCNKGIHRACYCAGRKECHDCGLVLE